MLRREEQAPTFWLETDPSEGVHLALLRGTARLALLGVLY